MFNLFKCELRKYSQELFSYYPDFIVGILISFVMYILVFSNRGLEEYEYIGYIFWILASSVLGEASVSISTEKQSGLLKNLLIKPYSIVSIMTFKTIAWFLINLIKIFFILILVKIFFPIKISFNPYLLLVLIVTMVSIYGFSLILMSLTIIYTKTASFESVIGFIFLFLSEKSLLLDKLPEKFSRVIDFFPYTLGINISKDIIKNDYVNFNHLITLIFLSIVYLLIGYLIFKYIIKRSQQYSSKY